MNCYSFQACISKWYVWLQKCMHHNLITSRTESAIQCCGSQTLTNVHCHANFWELLNHIIFPSLIELSLPRVIFLNINFSYHLCSYIQIWVSSSSKINAKYFQFTPKKRILHFVFLNTKVILFFLFVSFRKIYLNFNVFCTCSECKKSKC